MDPGCAPLSEAYYRQDYESDFEQDVVNGSESNRKNDVVKKELAECVPKPQKQAFAEECSKEQGRIRRIHDLSLDAYARHKKLVNEYMLCYRGCTTKLKRNTAKDRTDHDVIRENHRFLWDESETTDTWEKCLAKNYYDRLFKEYCLTDLSHFKENKIAMRWRTEKEVIDGKGQFICGSIHCHEKGGLKSWEVNFGYVEQGKKKNALVKLRLCPDCSNRLNFHQKYKEKVPKRKNQQYEQPRKKCKNSADPISAPKECMYQMPTDLSSERNVKQVSESEVWKNPVKSDLHSSKDEEFEDYLADMLL